MTAYVHWLDPLRQDLESGQATVAGCLSGTSADGIDVVLARFEAEGERASGAPRVLAFRTLPFPEELGARLRGVLDGASMDLAGVATLDRDLGIAFGQAVVALAREHGTEVTLVGSHGQTVWHHDGVPGAGRASLQLGDGARVAAAVGVPVVSDFRRADLAAGGEGAPLAALVDGELFAHVERPLAILNLGGMANLTWIDRGDERGVAFDTGPAGSLLDGLARRLLDRPLDAGGEHALRGRCDGSLLEEFRAEPFFEQAPPKSTGRDTFGEPYVERFLRRAEALAGEALRAEDVLATAVELVAWSVAQHLERFVPRPASRLLVAGGGVHNRALLAALERRTGWAVRSSAGDGVDPDAREALLFALLARRAVLGIPSTRAWATGARDGTVLGAIHLP